jgi:lipoprotein-anchoring transpeptidase ErfK/SrfK
VSGLRVCFRGGRLGQLAVLAVAGALGGTPHAEAAIYYWQDSIPVVARPAPNTPAAHRTYGAHHGDKKSKAVVDKEAKPQGPLIISISIAQQKLRLYDANGLYAESSISSGMPGHATPMGVFSVIQKQKFHQSNIYSGAPMPFMQRITWSGIAMHAGVVPGHPASHGCIRLPMAFAVKMYGWTRMGARVIITPGDVTPAIFSHPLLATAKVVPQPVAVEETKADVVAVKFAEMPAQIEPNALPTVVEAKIELRSTVGHVDAIKPANDESHPSTALKTADAGGAMPAAEAPGESSPKSQGDPNAARPDEIASSDEKPDGEKSIESEPAKTTGSDAAVGESSPKVAPADAPTNSAQADVPSQKPAGAAKTEAPPVAPAANTEMPLKGDLKSDFAKAASGPGFAFQGAGQIAVFVSRKDSKLYIRQNFAPLFQIPVTIAADARPLGTHIFTAQVDGKDRNALHWSVVSLPWLSKAADRRAEVEHPSRGRKFASNGPIEAKPLPAPDNPAEALDRLALPAEVMTKIYEALSTGGSIIVSDQGIAAGETGEGTDFIVSLR